MKKYIILFLIIFLIFILFGCSDEPDNDKGTEIKPNIEFVKVKSESLTNDYYFDIEVYNNGGKGDYYIEFYGKESTTVNPEWEIITDTKNYQIGSETKQNYEFEYESYEEYYENKLILYTQTSDGPEKTDEITVDIDNP